MTPGTGLLESVEQAVTAAGRIGYPVMLKSTAGGGGIGLTRCDDEAALRDAYDSVKRLGEQFFRDAGAFIERFVDRARHVEVQIFGDGQGRVVALGERDCSLQRRNQRWWKKPRRHTCRRRPARRCIGRRWRWASR